MTSLPIHEYPGEGYFKVYTLRATIPPLPLLSFPERTPALVRERVEDASDFGRQSRACSTSSGSERPTRSESG
jgi:hypothetical protein